MIAWMQARTAAIVATVLFGAPLLAFVLMIALVKGHASVAYYEAVSQIIPVVILALAIELRYFSPSRQLPKPLKARFRHPERAQPLAAGYAVATLLALIASEAIALRSSPRKARAASPSASLPPGWQPVPAPWSRRFCCQAALAKPLRRTEADFYRGARI